MACPLSFVSTHSRPKAAGSSEPQPNITSPSFNTQPPEGGWVISSFRPSLIDCFNTQPPEGGWRIGRPFLAALWLFQHTAARRRLGDGVVAFGKARQVSTHSRPKAAGQAFLLLPPVLRVSTHSRPKAAGIPADRVMGVYEVSTHSRPKAAGVGGVGCRYGGRLFQHTAARRRLADLRPRDETMARFNTQPPEGGWPYIQPLPYPAD